MPRAQVAIVVALALIAGWFLRIGAELLPSWDAIAVPVGSLAMFVLVAVLDRRIDKAIEDGIEAASDQDPTVTETNASGGAS